ncbi:hypothetical protein KTN05_03950 [Paracoccus sp. Z118]|uniref:hypothetical protein n=1 Tax=Paracoccus sp. Z118 TaxID=2851017 RepID=UPI001C2BD1B8|nr:hypothetical protein [Paracoccus sp. Z118]MBV0891001.1 hypothetical protein [Paracoccus sp. Z118]
MTRNLTLTALACLTLAACATPREQCISRNTSEYRTVSNLLAEVQGNLNRGYAWERRQTTRTEFDTCRDYVRTKDGEIRPFYRTCFRTVPDVERYRVAIDPTTETRKRDNLAARAAALRPGAETAVRACQAAYPEED